jgi:RHS repeat-associated protein
VHYDYDGAGFVTDRETYGYGSTTDRVTYGYDRVGRVSSVSSNFGAGPVALSYDAAGHLTGVADPTGNDYVETRGYDRDGRISSVTNKRGTVTLSSFVQTYDAASDPATLSMVSGGSATDTAYTYDGTGRLTKACYATSCAGASAYVAYGYDVVGNRTSENRVGVTNPGSTSYAYDSADELTSTTAGSTVTRYSYDASGDQTAAGARTFSYDLAGRVTSTRSGNTTTSYTYDGDGARITTSVNGSLTDTLTWDPIGPLPVVAIEQDSRGAVQRKYMHTSDGMPLSLTTPAGSYYYSHDQLGSVSDVTGPTGATEYDYTYEPFGAARTTVQPDRKAPTNPLRFTGNYLDTDTGLYNLRARLYNPAVGMFTTVDPELDSTGDAYRYAGQSPLRYTDPSGLCRVNVFSSAFWTEGNCLSDSIPEQWVEQYDPVYWALDAYGREIDAYRDGCSYWAAVGQGLDFPYRFWLMLTMGGGTPEPVLVPPGPEGGVPTGAGAAESGHLEVIGSGFSASERAAAETLAAQGRNVVLRQASGVGRTSDLLVDGVPYDVYTPTTGNLDRIVSAIASKGSQVNGGGVVLDLSESPLSGVDAATLLARVRGVTSRVSDIIVLGS